MMVEVGIWNATNSVNSAGICSSGENSCTITMIQHDNSHVRWQRLRTRVTMLTPLVLLVIMLDLLRPEGRSGKVHGYQPIAKKASSTSSWSKTNSHMARGNAEQRSDTAISDMASATTTTTTTTTTATSRRTRHATNNSISRNNNSTTTSSSNNNVRFRNVDEMLDSFRDGPVVLLLFTAVHCGPCRLQKRELASAIQQCPMPLRVVAIETAKWPLVGHRFKVGKLPCLLVIHDQTVLHRYDGFTRADVILGHILQQQNSTTTGPIE